MKWQTIYNDIDCGLFGMRHLECYTGGVISKFNCGLVKESEQQSARLIKLRKKYATKILMSDLNIKIKSFLEDATSFSKIEESTRKNILYNAYKGLVRQEGGDGSFPHHAPTQNLIFRKLQFSP
ncbi:hypothetical protein LXL04_015878 [Taraxacum kok-saghyz]